MGGFGVEADCAEVEPGRDDLGVVHHEQVAGLEQVDEIPDVAVVGRPLRPAVDEEPGCVSRLDRRLGDGRRREVVVELVEPHDPRG